MLSSPNATTTTLWETRPRSWLQHAANLEVCEAQTRCPLIKFPRLCFVRLKCHVLPIGSGQCLAVKWGTSSTWSYLLTPIFFLFFLCQKWYRFPLVSVFLYNKCSVLVLPGFKVRTRRKLCHDFIERTSPLSFVLTNCLYMSQCALYHPALNISFQMTEWITCCGVSEACDVGSVF